MEQITKLSINVLKVHPQNKEFFDDIEGEQYEKFKKSIQEDGIITPLVVAPDMTIISGHQRYKACNDLGIELVPVIINESLINEDDKLKKLLAANFGRLKNNPVKQGKVFTEYEKLCGITHGGARPKNSVLITQSEIARQLGVSVDTIQNLKKLQTLSPELQQLIEDGSVKYTTALNVYTKLSPTEQSQLIEELGRDKIAEMTQKQTEQYLLEKQQLKQSNEQLKILLQQEKNKEPEIIDNTDYEAMNKLKSDLEYQKKQYILAEEKEILLKEQLENYKDDTQKYKDLKEQIKSLTKKKDSISEQIEAGLSLVGYVNEVEEFLKTKLAPIQYSRALLQQQNNPTVIKNIIEIIECVEKWCQETRKYLPNNQKNIINVEEYK